MLSFCSYKNGNKLLSLLLQSNHAISMEGLEDALGLSRRSILYLIKKVNGALIDSDIPPIKNKKGQGYFLEDSSRQMLAAYDMEQLESDILTQPKKWRIPLKDLRRGERFILMNYIIITQPPVSIQTFMDIFQVSRNTVLQELRHLQEENEKQPFFKIEVTSAGRIADGGELQQRKWLFENFSLVLRLLERYYTLSTTADIPAILQSYETMIGSHLTDDSRHLMTYFLSWYDYRLAGQSILPASSGIPEEQDQLLMDWAAAFFARHNLTNQQECHYLCTVMKAQACESITHKNALYDDLHGFAESLTERFESLTGMMIGENRKTLIDRLTVHLISAYHRLKNNIQYHNPLLESIKTKYQNLFYITQAAVQSQEDRLQAHFSDDEIALIATYFGGELLAITEDKKYRPILVVCSSGIGTSQFLLLQLRERYSKLQFTGPLRTAECLKMSLQDVGLIITTTSLQPFKGVPCPVIKISPLPTEHEWETLHNRLVELDFPINSHLRESVTSLIDIISDYARIEDAEGLQNALSHYLYQKNHYAPVQPTEAGTDSLLKYVTYCENERQDISWKDAIQFACQSLLKGRFIIQSYIDRILELLTLYDDYIIIGKGVLLAHAKTKDGVIASSASITLFHHPVIMKSGREVRSIICLAPQNQTDHTEFLSILLQRLNDESWCQQFFSISSQKELEDFIWNG